jgi:hypothetical protein
VQGVRRDAWSFNQEQLKKHNQYTLPDFYSDPDTLTGAAKKNQSFWIWSRANNDL